MTVLRAQVRWTSAFDAEDDMMNTWHFMGQRAEADNATDMVEDFYTATSPYQSNSLASMMTNRSVTGVYEIKVYDLEDPKPRAPIYTRGGQVSVGNADALPQQLSLVFSYEAEGESGTRIQRLRNRVYLGGWPAARVSPQGRVVDTFAQEVLNAGRAMLEASEASINLSWCTFSPTMAAGQPNIEAGAREVARLWVDNSWDIQRRRKISASQRAVWPEV